MSDYNSSFGDDLAKRNAVAAADQLAVRTKVNTRGNQVVAGVTKGGVDAVGLGSLMPFTISHTSGTAAAETIAVGNPGSVVSSALGITVTDYDTAGSTWAPAALAEQARNGFLIGGLNYQVSVASQFANALIYGTSDLGKTTGSKPLNGLLTASQRSTDQNLLIKTLDFSSLGGQILVDTYNALFLTVAAGVSVVLTFTPGGVNE